MSERREQKSERTNGPILTSPFQEVLNLSAAVGKFVIHVHRTPHLVGWSFCWFCYECIEQVRLEIQRTSQTEGFNTQDSSAILIFGQFTDPTLLFPLP